MVGGDLTELLDKRWVIDVESAKGSEGLGSPLWFAALDPHTWSFGQDEHAEEDDQGPCELNCDRDAVAAGVVHVLGGVVDNGGKKETLADC